MNPLTLVNILLSLAGPGNPQPTRIEPGAVNPAILVDACRTAAADKSATLGAEQDSATLSSTGTGYAASGRACKRFIADFNVLAGANPADNHGTLEFDVSGGPTASLGQNNCTGTELIVVTYEKVPGSSAFVQRTTAKYKAVWHDTDMFDTCDLERVTGTNPPSDTPDPSGTEVWRVAVSASRNGTPLPVTARLAFDIIPW